MMNPRTQAPIFSTALALLADPERHAQRVDFIAWCLEGGPCGQTRFLAGRARIEHKWLADQAFVEHGPRPYVAPMSADEWARHVSSRFD